MTQNKKYILYFEDDDSFRNIAKRFLEEDLPMYTAIMHEGGARGNTQVCVDEVLAQIQSLDEIAIVCTDGNLSGFVTGWSVMEELRQRGYNGPAIYTGGNPLPNEKAHLYKKQTSKFGNDLINAIKQYAL